MVTEKGGHVSIRKTKRKFDTVVSLIPIGCLSVTWFICGFAIIILATESNTYLEMVQNPKLWTWSIGVILPSCGAIAYKVWVVDDLNLSVKLANEIIAIQQELVAGKEFKKL